jgi:trehalose 6-phosphate synthase
MAGDNELLILSNRGPLSVSRGADGDLIAKRGGGGLVVTLGPGAERESPLWIAAAVGADDEEAARRGLFDGSGHDFRVHPVVVDPVDYRAYYGVVANQTLWFCLHGLWDLPRRPRFDRHWWSAWERFRAVNEQFAEAASDTAAPGATVLVQDYQLALVPALLARHRPDLRTAAFVHTPWCSPQELAVLPDSVAAEILTGLAGGGSCGFHSSRWAAAFVACCREVLGQTPVTFVAPASTDVDDLRSVAGSEECAQELARLEAAVGDRRLIVRVDRMELSKNVLRGFWAFDELLQGRPDLRGEVVFAAMVYPSRLGLAEYLAYGQEVRALAAQINAKWMASGRGSGRESGGTEGSAGSAGVKATGRSSGNAWTPIMLDSEDNYPSSVAALRRADVLLVNPVRDGLNLVAKEGPLVNERDGVLVLSHQAGSWDELGEHAVGVNPFDVAGTAQALAAALDLPTPERSARARSLRKLVEARSPLDWFDEQRAAARTP